MKTKYKEIHIATIDANNNITINGEITKNEHGKEILKVNEKNIEDTLNSETTLLSENSSDINTENESEKVLEYQSKEIEAIYDLENKLDAKIELEL